MRKLRSYIRENCDKINRKGKLEFAATVKIQSENMLDLVHTKFLVTRDTKRFQFIQICLQLSP